MMSPTIAVVRNEVDADYEYHCDALASHFPDAQELTSPAGERPDIEGVDGVVLTGSTAGVYERNDRPWIGELEDLVRDLLERRVPTLGVCFGHQVVNTALGGTVDHVGTTCRLVDVDLADDPLFSGVSSIVPVAHGDVVTEIGEGMDVIGSADYYEAFCTRHREAPLWTVQFHPEFTPGYRKCLEADFGWTETGHTFEDVTATRVFENFREIVRRQATR